MTSAPAAEYLDQAKAAAVQIALPGDQSGALQAIALTLVRSDPAAALDLAARMRRPSDAARALGAISVAIASNDPTSAAQDVVTAGRLLLRIPSPDQRLAEQRMLLREIAHLAERALPAGPELTPGDAQLQVVLGLADSEPAAALALLKKWQLRDAAYDQAAAVIAERLAAAKPDEAIEVASSIISMRERESALWRIAELRPPEEATGIATGASDPVVQSGILRSAAARLAKSDPSAAATAAASVTVATTSVQAEMVVALASTDDGRATELARALPEPARTWALERIAVTMAASKPAAAEKLLRDLRAPPEAMCLAAAAMARTDSDRAMAFARSLPPGEARDAVLTYVTRALGHSNVAKATELLWDMGPSVWRARAVSTVAPVISPANIDQATGLIGLVADPAEAARIRAEIAASIAGRNPDMAARLLGSLPPSDAKTTGALNAAVAVLAAGGQPDVAISLGSLGVERDLAIRWMMPQLAYSETRSPVGLAGEIGSPYLRALAFVDIARELLGYPPKPRPAPDRAAQIRPVVEWEGM
jgi:hypothetical protein